MIKKVNEAWKRLLSNDYAYFLIVPLLFAIVSIPVSTLFLRLGWFEQTDVNTFSTQWVMGFLFACLTFLSLDDYSISKFLLKCKSEYLLSCLKIRGRRLVSTN